MTTTEPLPTITLLPTQDGDDIPPAALRVESADVNGSTLFLKLAIVPKNFDPGSHSAVVIAHASYLGPNQTAVAVSRSENDKWKVLGLGFVAAFVGLVWLLALASKAIDASAFSLWRLIFLCVVAVGAGVVAAGINYWSQDVWTFDDNGRSLATAAFLATSSGSIAALITGSSKPGGGGV